MSKNPLKSLASETVIYGFSTIFARFINFIFVPLYTYKLSTESYGVATEFLAYIAILQVILTLGLETGCFRFANKNRDSNLVFSNALTTVTIVAGSLLLLSIPFRGAIASALGYKAYSIIIIYVTAILFFDSVTAILFARLRFLNKAIKFALFKSIKILSETLFNFLLFFGAPTYFIKNPHSILLNLFSATPDFTYILFAIFASTVISLLIFIPDLLKIKFKISYPLWREMMRYSLPIMIAGLPGILNDFADRVLFRFFAPEGLVWESELGIFQAGVKISMLMMLFIQMFRFAAEPFFFAKEGEKESKVLYAKVMEHFTAIGIVIFMAILFYMDIIQYIIGSHFRAGLSIVPIMLLSYLLLGINFNVSMWYKLSEKTNWAIIITLAGLPITLIINILLMPYYSYHAAAWAHLASYLTMLVLSIYLGNRHYPIPYRWKRVGGYILLGLAFWGLSEFISPKVAIIKYLLNTLLIIIYIWVYYKSQKKEYNGGKNSQPFTI